MNPLRTGVAVAALVLMALGTAFAESLCFLVALPALAWFFLGEAFPPSPVGVSMERILSTSFPDAGIPVRVTVKLCNRGERAQFVRFVDHPPSGAAHIEGLPEWEGSLEAGACAEIRYSACFARGVWHFGYPSLVVEDPFSGARTSIPTTCKSDVIVPPVKSRSCHPFFGPETARPFGGLSRARRPGSGTDFSGTRDYVPGDSVRTLNWRAEALWGRPVVNIYEEERAIDIGLLLDARSIAYSSSGLFESSVKAAASYAESFFDSGDRVSFMCYGSTMAWTPPGSGRMHRYTVRKAIARAKLGSHAVFARFDAVPPRLFPPKSAILVVSPLLGEDVHPLRCLKALGYSVAVLRPETGHSLPGKMTHAAELAGRIVALEDEILVRRMLGAGIEMIRWDVSLPLKTARMPGKRRLR